MDKIRCSVVGCGRMGLRRARTIVNHPEAELRYVSDVNSELAKKVAQDFGVEAVEVGEAISKSDVDCVIVSVPNKFHPEIVIPALERGKHVWCEKPLARNPEEGWKMVEAAIKNDCFLKVGSNLRYFPSVQKGKELLDAEAIGEILFLRGWVGNSGWQLKSWYSEVELIGGGTFLDNGVHLLDIYRWFLGEAVECIGYVSTAYWPVHPLEDNGMGIFKFENGCLAFLHSSWTEWADYMYMEIYGKEGYIKIDNRMPNCITILGRKDGSQEIFDFSRLPPKSYELEFNDFIKAIKENQQPSPSGFDGLRAVEMAFGVYESAKSGRSVSIWRKEHEQLLETYKRIAGDKK